MDESAERVGADPKNDQIEQRSSKASKPPFVLVQDRPGSWAWALGYRSRPVTEESAAPMKGTHSWRSMIVVTIMVVVIPITVMMPAVFVYVPPLLASSPTALPDLVQFLAPMIRLGAVVSVVFNRLVEFVIGACSAPLAIVVIGARAGQADEQEHSSQCRGSQCPLSEQHGVAVI